MKTYSRWLVAGLFLAPMVFVGGCARLETPRLSQLNDIITAAPTNSWEIANRGHVYALLGERRLAIADLQRASKIGGSGDMHSRIGWSYFNLGDYRSAIHEWQLAADKNKFSRDYDFYTLAVGFWAVKDYQQAMIYYQRLVKFRPDYEKLDALEARMKNFTAKEKDALRSVYLLWNRAYVKRD